MAWQDDQRKRPRRLKYNENKNQGQKEKGDLFKPGPPLLPSSFVSVNQDSRKRPCHGQRRFRQKAQKKKYPGEYVILLAAGADIGEIADHSQKIKKTEEHVFSGAEPDDRLDAQGMQAEQQRRKDTRQPAPCQPAYPTIDQADVDDMQKDVREAVNKRIAPEKVAFQ